MYRVALFLVFALGSAALSSPAAACGLKLAINAPKVQRRSANPSTIVLYDTPRERILRRALQLLGHNVVVAHGDDLGGKPAAGAVIFAEPSSLRQAQTLAPNAIVIPIDKSVRANIKTLEAALKKRRDSEAAAIAAPTT